MFIFIACQSVAQQIYLKLEADQITLCTSQQSRQTWQLPSFILVTTHLPKCLSNLIKINMKAASTLSTLRSTVKTNGRSMVLRYELVLKCSMLKLNIEFLLKNASSTLGIWR